MAHRPPSPAAQPDVEREEEERGDEEVVGEVAVLPRRPRRAGEDFRGPWRELSAAERGERAQECFVGFRVQKFARVAAGVAEDVAAVGQVG